MPVNMSKYINSVFTDVWNLNIRLPTINKQPRVKYKLCEMHDYPGLLFTRMACDNKPSVRCVCVWLGNDQCSSSGLRNELSDSPRHACLISVNRLFKDETCLKIMPITVMSDLRRPEASDCSVFMGKLEDACF